MTELIIMTVLVLSRYFSLRRGTMLYSFYGVLKLMAIYGNRAPILVVTHKQPVFKDRGYFNAEQSSSNKQIDIFKSSVIKYSNRYLIGSGSLKWRHVSKTLWCFCGKMI